MSEKSHNTPKVVVITGPTGAGKTALSVAMAQELGGEIVSADSMQVYRGFDIGTAKVTAAEMQGVAHHMLDVAEPNEAFSVARYVEEAARCVDDILRRGKLPIIVGGTGLYIDSLVSGRDFAGEDNNYEVRQELDAEYDTLGGEAMLDKLREIDPLRAARLHASDKRRIVRALEVFRVTGKTITAHDLETQMLPARYDAAVIALSFKDRDALYSRIDARVDAMMAQGLLGEVHRLLDEGASQGATAMQAIGYKEIAAFLRGETDLETAIETIKRESRRYAKRQLTWLRRHDDLFWILWENEPDFAQARLDSAKFLHARGIK